MASSKRVACILILKTSIYRAKGNSVPTYLHPSIHAEADSVQKLAEACIRFTPEVALRGEEAIFLEISKSLTLFSEASLKSRILILAKKLGLEVKIHFDQHPCIALAKARSPEFELSRDFSSLSIDHLPLFLNPFEQPSEQTWLEVQKLISTLKSLSIFTVKDFVCLPRASLGSRFGKIAILLHGYCQAEVEPVWKVFTPSPKIEESIDLDPEASGTDLALILFPLKTLLDRSMIRLRGLGKRASLIQVKINIEPWSFIKNPKIIFNISLHVAQGSASGLLPIIREILSVSLEKEPLLSPVRSIYLNIIETVPGYSSQRDFFHSCEIYMENRDKLLGRLIQQLGKENVFHAKPLESYHPEKSWEKRLDPSNSSRESLFLQRPSRILAQAESLIFVKSTNTLIHTVKNMQWKVLHWEGPERISTEWWEQPILRDYYQLTTQVVEHSQKLRCIESSDFLVQKLWIYLDHQAKGATRIHAGVDQKSPASVFLHGYFD